MIATATRTLLLGAVLALGSAAPALGAERYAAPEGTGDPTVCAQADPCDLETAVEDDSVQNGDEVIVTPGDYSIGQLDVFDAIHVHGEDGQPRPVVQLAGPNDDIFVNHPNALVGDLEIEGGRAIRVRDGTVERVVAEATGPDQFACQQATAAETTIRDSFCWASGPGGSGVGTALGTFPGVHTSMLRNVTAVGTGTGGRGIRFDVSQADVSFEVDAKSVIAQGDSVDVRARGTLGAITTITLDHSSYGTEEELDSGTVTDPGTGTNQDADDLPPALVDTASGDFHQLAGSPTVNAGAIDAESGGTDIDGDLRGLGAAPDIGADEIDGPAPDAPAITSTDPASPANENNPRVKGTAEDPGTVRLYTTVDCTGTLLAQGSSSEFASPGLTVDVPDDSSTILRATVTVADTSLCSEPFDYVEDSTAPAAPAITDIDPDSGANDNNPRVKGTAEAGSTVRLYRTASCTGAPVAQGSASSFASPGLTANVPDNSSTTFRATATDAAGNTSPCSGGFIYDEVTPPPPPQQPPPDLEISGKPKQKAKRLTIDVGCGAVACSVELEGTGKVPRVPGAAVAAKAKRFGLKPKSVEVAAGQTETVRVRFRKNRKTVKKIKALLAEGTKKTRGRAKVVVRATATSAGGTATAKQKIKLKR